MSGKGCISVARGNQTDISELPPAALKKASNFLSMSLDWSTLLCLVHNQHTCCATPWCAFVHYVAVHCNLTSYAPRVKHVQRCMLKSGLKWSYIMSVRCVYVPIVEVKFILRLIYFRNSDFKGLSTVATVPDHQRNKTCWCWDSFRHPKLL